MALTDYMQADSILSILGTIVLVVLMFIIVRLLLHMVRSQLRKRATTKHQRHNVEIFSRITWYSVVVAAIILVIVSSSGDWTGFGVAVGLMSAALGWALQKPITGMAAWIMVVTTGMFKIGDRIIIGTTRGDVVDMSLTHIYMREVGGVLNTEEDSGRVVMIPNSSLFDFVITNYTLQNEVLISEVSAFVTYDSDVDKALALALDAAKEEEQRHPTKGLREPYNYTEFIQSGVNVRTRFFVPAASQDIARSRVTKGILDRFKDADDIRFAFQHQQVYLGDDSPGKASRS